MSNQTLLEAACAKVAEREGVNGFYRPVFHLASPCGWINDPNGLCRFRGEYHAFFQLAPYDSFGGLMYWGHARSKDLIKWEYLPVALAPDRPYDKSGCWSGSAVERDGKLYVMYTGHCEEDGVRTQTQNLALSEDGIVFVKDELNPVITAECAPDGVRKEDFRDPFVWEQNGKYYCVVGTLQDGVPTALTYRSDDLRHWQYLGVFLQRKGSGYCYECPNFAHLDGADLLLLSPVDFPADGLRFGNMNSVVSLFGTFCEETGAFEGGTFGEVDAGTDFYATQLVRTPDGRTVMLAWLNLWGRTQVTAELGHGWQGMCSIPREIWREGEVLMQRPVAELERYECDAVTAACELTDGECAFAGVEGRSVRLRVEADLTQCERFEIRLFACGEHDLLAVYDCAEEVFTLDRRRTVHPIRGNAREQEGVRSTHYPCGRKLVLDILLDRCSAEVFLGRGERAMSMLAYNEEGAGVRFAAQGRARIKVKKTTLKVEG